MTLNATSVISLVCSECDADLRGAPKVQRGDAFVCASCALLIEYRHAHGPRPAQHGASRG